MASLRKGDVGAEPQWSREAEKAVPAATGSYLLGAGMWSPPDQRSRAAYSCQSFNTGGSDHGGTPIAPAEGFVLRASQRGAMLLHLPRALIFTTQLRLFLKKRLGHRGKSPQKAGGAVVPTSTAPPELACSVRPSEGMAVQ